MSSDRSESPVIPPGAVLGILGGGQLGGMFVHAAQRMGYRVHCFTDRPGPATAAADRTTIAGFDDHAALDRFAADVAAVTLEFENVSADAVARLSGRLPVRPGARVLAVASDRERERRAVADAGFALAPWRVIDDAHPPDPAGVAVASVLKTATSGYDGKGQATVQPGDDLAAAWRAVGGGRCVLEERIDFAAELSALVARGVDGRTAVHGPFLNDHANHVLDVTRFPAPVDPVVAAEARRIAEGLGEALDLVGLLCVELFLLPGGGLLVNEVAPRPHNSGHVTIEACTVSQFEQQVRTTCGLPLGDPAPRSPGAMCNLLGDLWDGDPPDWAGMLAEFPDVSLHLYGKEPRPGRKLGHLTALADSPDAAALRVRAARTRLRFRRT